MYSQGERDGQGCPYLYHSTIQLHAAANGMQQPLLLMTISRLIEKHAHRLTGSGGDNEPGQGEYKPLTTLTSQGSVTSAPSRVPSHDSMSDMIGSRR